MFGLEGGHLAHGAACRVDDLEEGLRARAYAHHLTARREHLRGNVALKDSPDR
jgi:hypothetical protein